ncbi:hypothetical protein [Mailhella sp.]
MKNFFTQCPHVTLAALLAFQPCLYLLLLLAFVWEVFSSGPRMALSCLAFTWKHETFFHPFAFYRRIKEAEE